MSTILVTGRNGFIANALVEALKKDHKIISLVRSQKDHLDYANEELFIADLLSLPAEQLKAYKIDLIVHAAALIQGHPDVVEKSNVQTAENAFHVAERLGVPVIFFSSANVLFAEKLGGYARSKKTAEDMLRESTLRYLILRVPFVLGPGSATVRTIRDFAQRSPYFPLFGPERGKTHVVSIGTVTQYLQERIAKNKFGQETINLLGRQTYIYPEIIENIVKRKIRFVVLPYGFSLQCCELLEKMKIPFPVTSEQIKSLNIDKVIDREEEQTIFIDEDPKNLFG